jgi:hypothetical protein
MHIRQIPFLVLASLLLSGCSTTPMPDPVIAAEKSAPALATPARKILLVIDLGLETQAYGVNMNPRREAHLRSFYDPAAKALVDAATQAGFDADYLLVYDGSPAGKRDGNYSHIWTQTLVRATSHTDLRSGNVFLNSRKWTGSVRQGAITGPGGSTELYRSDYASDGVSCFNSLHIIPEKDACRNTYVRVLLAQLTKAGVRR